MTLVGCYPGSFDPPTVAHLAVAEAARDQAGLDRLDLVLSRRALGKEGAERSPLEARAAALCAVAGRRPWLAVAVTEARLLADVAAGYDVLVMGADKWAQVLDPAWYGGSEEARDEAVGRLPRVLVAPRAGWPAPPGVEVLDVHPAHLEVSSTAAVAGRSEWLLEPPP